MKRLLIGIIAVLWTGVAHAWLDVDGSVYDYTVCASGCDYATIAAVNAATFASGDVVAFKRGETFTTTQLIPGSSVIYTSYGKGDRPIIEDGIFNDHTNGGYTLDGLEIQAKVNLNAINIKGLSNITINDCIVDGKARSGKWAILVEDNVAGTVYSSNITITNNIIKNAGIMGAQSGSCVSLSSGTYDSIVKGNIISECSDNAIVTYGSSAGSHDNDILENYVSSSLTSGPVGINIGFLSRNNTVKGNYIFGHGVGIQFDAAVYDVNLTTDNIIYDSGTLFLVLSNSNGNSDNGKFLNNTLIGGNHTAKMTWYRTTAGSQSGHEFKNNIVLGLKKYTPLIAIEDNVIVDSDYNIFYDTLGDPRFYYGSAYPGGASTSFSDYKTASGLDQNSSYNDPTLNSYYYPIPGSPAIDPTNSICLSEVTDDYRGRLRPYGTTCDIGAYEFTRGLSFK